MAELIALYWLAAAVIVVLGWAFIAASFKRGHR